MEDFDPSDSKLELLTQLDDSKFELKPRKFYFSVKKIRNFFKIMPLEEKYNPKAVSVRNPTFIKMNPTCLISEGKLLSLTVEMTSLRQQLLEAEWKRPLE